MKPAVIAFFSVLLFCYFNGLEAKRKEPPETFESNRCFLCRKMQAQFFNRLIQTRKMKFGRRREADDSGPWKNSELRLLDIADEFCEHFYGPEQLYECHRMAIIIEVELEKWWANSFNETLIKQADLFHRLCIDVTKLCCDGGFYGPDCVRCLGMPYEKGYKMCMGHGYCNGAGNRGGNGKCVCEDGYVGELCDSCAADHYVGVPFEHDEQKKELLREIEKLNCTACNHACGSCTGPEVKDCLECRFGYQNVTGLCEDINECLTEGDQKICHKPNEVCNNTQGGYECVCRESYYKNRLSGACEECGKGYSIVKDECIDDNECADAIKNNLGNLCTKENEKCNNTLGSYECICNLTHIRKDDGECHPCPPGQIGVDGVCQDENECERSRFPCGAHEKCIDIEGGFECVCDSISVLNASNHCVPCGVGHVAINNECVDIDECEKDKSLCDEVTEVCVNVPGTYECKCAPGYERSEEDYCQLPDNQEKEEL